METVSNIVHRMVRWGGGKLTRKAEEKGQKVPLMTVQRRTTERGTGSGRERKNEK